MSVCWQVNDYLQKQKIEKTKLISFAGSQGQWRKKIIDWVKKRCDVKTASDFHNNTDYWSFVASSKFVLRYAAVLTRNSSLLDRMLDEVLG